MGQINRASKLAQTYADINNDEDVEYDLHRDSLLIESPYEGDTVFYGNHIPRSNDTWSRTLKRYKKGNAIDAEDEPGTNFIPSSARTENPFTAKRLANHLNNFSSEERFSSIIF